MSEKQPSNVIHMSQYREEVRDAWEITLEDFHNSNRFLLSCKVDRQDSYLKITSEYLIIPLAEGEEREDV